MASNPKMEYQVFPLHFQQKNQLWSGLEAMPLFLLDDLLNPQGGM